MKFLFDLFPVIIFIATYQFAKIKTGISLTILSKVLLSIGMIPVANPKLVPILLATIALIICAIIQIIIAKFIFKKVDKILWISTLLAIVLGGLTLYFQNPSFINWKPTIVYWIMSLTLIMASIFKKKNLIKIMMGETIKLPDSIWNKMNSAWIIFFLLLGTLNLYVAFNYPDVWGYFKASALFITFGFAAMQIFLVRHHIIEDKA